MSVLSSMPRSAISFTKHANLFEQPAAKQTMAAKVVFAVALEIGLGLFRDVERITLLHQLLRLLIGISECLGDRGAAAIEEVLIDVTAKVLSGSI
jgi:hypothetical protein